MRGSIADLDEAIKQVCPIHGVSWARAHEKRTWRIDFKDEATTEQKAAAFLVLESFRYDPSVGTKRQRRLAAIQADPTVPQSLKDLFGA